MPDMATTIPLADRFMHGAFAHLRLSDCLQRFPQLALPARIDTYRTQLSLILGIGPAENRFLKGAIAMEHQMS